VTLKLSPETDDVSDNSDDVIRRAPEDDDDVSETCDVISLDLVACPASVDRDETGTSEDRDVSGTEVTSSC